jgi:hypothetical protein
VEKSQLEKSQLEKSQLEKSQLEKSRLEKSGIKKEIRFLGSCFLESRTLYFLRKIGLYKALDISKRGCIGPQVS